jgi:pyruvate/2-oxoglutarate dehydrogenase complex dihydrolipoamide acyltransferase (E2) component
MADLLDVAVPSLGDGIETVLLVAWHVKPGGLVSAEELLYEVETDKAVFEVEAEVSGTLEEVLVPAGEPVAPGAVVARIKIH